MKSYALHTACQGELFHHTSYIVLHGTPIRPGHRIVQNYLINKGFIEPTVVYILLTIPFHQEARLGPGM